MKKWMIIITALIMAVGMGNAANKEVKQTMQTIRGDFRINVVFDYSTTQFMGMNQDDFSKLIETERGEIWSSVLAEWYRKFCEEVNSQLSHTSYYVGNFADATTTIILHVDILEHSGDMVTRVEMIHNGEVFANYLLKIKGGHIGSVVNLMGDGHENLGEEIGKMIKMAK